MIIADGTGRVFNWRGSDSKIGTKSGWGQTTTLGNRARRMVPPRSRRLISVPHQCELENTILDGCDTVVLKLDGKSWMGFGWLDFSGSCEVETTSWCS